MKSMTADKMKQGMIGVVLGAAMLSSAFAMSVEMQEELPLSAQLEKIQLNRENPAVLAQMLPIVHCSFTPSKFEEILMTQLRDVNSSTKQFRRLSDQIGELLVNKVVECLPTKDVEIETPVAGCQGKELAEPVELCSIMRSGDALLETFMNHFPEANVSKFLIQRDEQTSLPHFKYMKVSSTIASGNQVIITEPMIATGGTLDMVLGLLKEKGVKEENIVIASVCVAPEGLLRLNQKYPKIKVVMNVLDHNLNEKNYIVPGLGDFGDRYFGTMEKSVK